VKWGGAAGAIVGVILAVIVVTQQWPQLITKNSTFTVGAILFPGMCVFGAVIAALLIAFIAAMFSLFSPSDLPERALRNGSSVMSPFEI
jgi:hypothetical protein